MSLAVQQFPAFFLHAPCTHHDHDQHWIRGGEGGNEVLLNITDQRFFLQTPESNGLLSVENDFGDKANAWRR